MHKGVQMFVRRTATQPPFLFAYTNWTLDQDVSQHMHASGLIEGGIGKVRRGCGDVSVSQHMHASGLIEGSGGIGKVRRQWVSASAWDCAGTPTR